jgi:hypothetical protein
MVYFRLWYRRRKLPELKALGAAASMILTVTKECASAFPLLEGAIRAVDDIWDLKHVHLATFNQ